MTNPVKLNKRLLEIANIVKDGAKVLDVGCDHALLDIYLTLENRGVKAIASDIKEGPLEKAKENIRKYQLSKKIEVRLGPGIETIDDAVDTIVICGMGGMNMVGILKYKRNLLKNVKQIILSPNNYPENVRKEISKLGYFIEDEVLVEENHFIYPIIVFQKGRKFYQKKSYVYGPILLYKKGDLFIKYIKMELSQKEKLLKVLPKKYIKRTFQLKAQIRKLKKILKTTKKTR